MEQNSTTNIVGDYAEFQVKGLIAGTNVIISTPNGFPIVSNSNVEQGVESIYEGNGINVSAGNNPVITNDGIQDIITYNTFIDISDNGISSLRVVKLNTFSPLTNIKQGNFIGVSKNNNDYTINNLGVLDISCGVGVGKSGLQNNPTLSAISYNNFSYKIQDLTSQIFPSWQSGNYYPINYGFNLGNPYFIGKVFDLTDPTFSPIIDTVNNTILPFNLEFDAFTGGGFLTPNQQQDLPNDLIILSSLVLYDVNTNQVITDICSIEKQAFGSNFYDNNASFNTNFIKWTINFSFNDPIPYTNPVNQAIGINFEIGRIDEGTLTDPAMWNTTDGTTNLTYGYFKLQITT